ncbi:MAG: beta-ketoacyl synthase chain length factor [Gammaproteobacteria bacterium]|nr:beta-ketoacyl synthase chain length factor [Gammaproteobacteria bacterium]
MQQTGENIGGFAVSRWHAWAPGVESAADWDAWLAGRVPGTADTLPDLSQLPALLRRRLDRLGRMALHTAWPCLDGLDAAQFVFASRDGSLARTLELLAALAHDEPLSPAVFSVSVHNGTTGLCSIARGDRSATTAVAAGRDSLGMGLLEAACEVSAGAEHVVMCYADQNLPPPYATAPGRGVQHQPFSISLLLERATPKRESCRLIPCAQPATENPEVALLRFLAEHATSTIIGADQCWRLERSAGAGHA